MTTKTIIGPDTPLLDYYKTHYERLKLMGKSESVRSQYESNIVTFGRFLEHPATLADLTDDNLVAFLGWLQSTSKTDGKARSPATVNKLRGQLVALWRYAARKRHAEDWPDVPKLPEFKRLPTAWTPAQVARLLATIEASARTGPQFIPRTRVPVAAWWLSFLLAIYDCGGRLSAMLAVRLDDFERESGRLILRAENQKQKQDQGFILSDQTRTAIGTSIDADPERDLLFPWPLAKATLFNHYQAFLKAAGLPTTRRDKFHRMRRTAATLCELHVGRGTATFHLGHSSPLITAAYIDTSKLPESAVATKFPRPEAVPTEPIVGVVRRQSAPMGGPARNAEAMARLTGTPIGKLLDEFTREVLEAKGKAHVARGEPPESAYRVAMLLAAINARKVSDLDAARVLAHLVDMRKDGWTDNTVEKYRRSFARFVRWLATDQELSEAARCHAAFPSRFAGKDGAA